MNDRLSIDLMISLLILGEGKLAERARVRSLRPLSTPQDLATAMSERSLKGLCS
jgi:hypothetical protein